MLSGPDQIPFSWMESVNFSTSHLPYSLHLIICMLGCEYLTEENFLKLQSHALGYKDKPGDSETRTSS